MFIEILKDFLQSTGFASITVGQIIMLLISFVLLYLAIKKEFEPLLLLPIALECFANLPLAGLMKEPVTEIVHRLGKVARKLEN